ncbi:cyclic-di-AMP receptor, partial [Staphylococcus epidermidis]|uniref:cyclic-di-AMP receptor n=1 Tax=Staphylococcus epidermidis TaxID=1282 RepID=UPI0011A698D1
VEDEDSEEVSEQLVKKNLRGTKLGTSGGFLRGGNRSLLCGVKDEGVDEVVCVIDKSCGNREEVVWGIRGMGGSGD